MSLSHYIGWMSDCSCPSCREEQKKASELKITIEEETPELQDISRTCGNSD